jgi:hypothetical protein
MGTSEMTTNGFSKGFQQRIEKEMLKNAQKQARMIPQLPAELAQQIAGGVASAMQGKFSNIQVGLGSPDNVQHVRILIFKDEMQDPHTLKQPVIVAERQSEPVLAAVPGSAPVPENLSVDTTPVVEEKSDTTSVVPG